MSTGLPQPLHPDVSHIHPDYRDGWNNCLKLVLAALAAPATVQPAIEQGEKQVPVAWALYDSHGYYETRDTEQSCVVFCEKYNAREVDPQKPYSYRPLYTSPPTHDSEIEALRAGLVQSGVQAAVPALGYASQSFCGCDPHGTYGGCHYHQGTYGGKHREYKCAAHASPTN